MHCRNLQVKCRRPRAWHPVCVSLRSRNAHGQNTRTISCRNLQVKCRRPRAWHPFCVSLRSRNAHGQNTRTILCRNLQVKCRRPRAWHPFCVSLRSRNAHGQNTRTILIMQKITGKMPQTKSVTPVLCEPAQSKCTWTSHKSMFIYQSNFIREFTGERAGSPSEHLDQAPAWTLTVSTPQYGYTVWGCLGNIYRLLFYLVVTLERTCKTMVIIIAFREAKRTKGSRADRATVQLFMASESFRQLKRWMLVRSTNPAKMCIQVKYVDGKENDKHHQCDGHSGIRWIQGKHETLNLGSASELKWISFCRSVIAPYIEPFLTPCQLRGGAVQPFCSEETACIASSSTKWMRMHDRISLLNVGPWFSWSAKFGYIFRVS